MLPIVTDNIIDLVGNTPLLELKKYSPPPNARLFAKLEYLNPGGSVKDRAALGMILAAEESGELKPGATIIEPTAGNTGIGLALIGAARGYKVILCVPEGYSQEKMQVMAAFGGTIHLIPKQAGMQAAIDHAHKLAAEIPGSFVPQQFENLNNSRFHEETTGAEIVEQMDGRIDAIVMGAGTAGTVSGIARAVKKVNPHALCVLVEPEGSIFGGGCPGTHKVEGIGQSQFIPKNLDREAIDEIMMSYDHESFVAVKKLAALEGVLAGGSGGSAAAAALKVCERLGHGKRVVTLIPDSAERYISQGIFQEDLEPHSQTLE